jgi:hypothetical protein
LSKETFQKDFDAPGASSSNIVASDHSFAKSHAAVERNPKRRPYSRIRLFSTYIARIIEMAIF